jgi:hypothetical protein
MVGTKTPRRASDLEFKGKIPMEEPRTRWFHEVPADIKKRGKSWQEMKKEKLEEGKRDWRLLIH